MSTPVSPDVEEMLDLFDKLGKQEKHFFLDYMRAVDRGMKPVPTEFHDRFWSEYFDRWKAGDNPFVDPRTMSMFAECGATEPAAHMTGGDRNG